MGEKDLWFSQKALSQLFEVSLPNINIHISDLKCSGQHVVEKVFELAQIEGTRTINRKVKHYSFEVACAIGIRSQRFEKLHFLQNLALREGCDRQMLHIAPIKEQTFGKLLTGALSGIAKIVTQHHVPPYFIDFYFPDIGLAVEYDEHHHMSPRQSNADAEREQNISSQLRAKFIRVQAGKEVEGLNSILKFILEKQSNAFRSS